jgi:hypothetical protein
VLNFIGSSVLVSFFPRSDTGIYRFDAKRLEDHQNEIDDMNVAKEPSKPLAKASFQGEKLHSKRVKKI